MAIANIDSDISRLLAAIDLPNDTEYVSIYEQDLYQNVPIYEQDPYQNVQIYEQDPYQNADQRINGNNLFGYETIDTTTYDISSSSTDPALSSGFKSYIPDISTQEDIDDELCLPMSYQFMFDKRTSPWEMQDWDQDELNAFVIQVEKIERLYHMVANDEDPNFRTWEICCRVDYKGEKYFVEMYANCDYTGFDCQGGGYICITKLPDFFLSNMVSKDQKPDEIYKALLEDGYNVQEPDPLHKIHPKFWNNAPMLKYICHNAIYKNKGVLSHFKEQLPQVLANSVDDFIKVKDWENE